MSAAWWAGCYGPDAGGTGEGIMRLRSRPDGALELDAVAARVESPSFLLLDGPVIHAAAEGAGRVESFSIDGFERLSSADSGGRQPCHLSLIDGRVVVANYGDGVLGVTRGDDLLQAIDPVGVGAHAHASLKVSASVLLSLDLGADCIHLYSLEEGGVVRTGAFALPAGTGPRDVVRHPSGALLVLGESAGVLIVLDWDGRRLELRQRLDLPGFRAGDHAAAIAISGRFVYSGVRGSNVVSVIRFDRAGLEPVGAISCAGDWPRHLVAHESILHVANERSSTVASFRLGVDGMPTPIGVPSAVPTPTHLVRGT